METSSGDNHYPYSRSWLIGVLSSMTALSAIFVGLRLTSRRLKQQQLWWDDRLIIISMACNFLSVGLMFAMYSQGLGLSASVVAETQVVSVAKLYLTTKIMVAWNLCITKLSILFMYYRMFDMARGGKTALIAIGALVVLWSFISTCLFIFACAPIPKSWDPSLSGYCIDLLGRWIANAVSTVLSDLVIILLPVPQVFRMTLSRVEKLAVTLVFAQSFFVVFASTYRYVLLFSFYDASNATYTLTPVTAWTEIDIASGIIAACLPVLGPLLPKTTRQTLVFSGTSWSDSRRRPSKKLSADSGQPFFMTTEAQCAPAADVWDWSRCVESLTRPAELAKMEHQATASRARNSDIVDIPLHGISVKKDFRRWSEIESLYS